MPFFGDRDLDANLPAGSTPGRLHIRELPLLDGENPEERFAPYDGLTGDTTHKGPLLVITNQRVVSFRRDNGRKETYVAALEELKGVSVKADSRGIRNLFQGFTFILFGIMAYFIVGYITNSVWSEISIASALGAAIVFVGLLYIAKHFFWEQEGNIVFQGGTWERSDKAGGTEAYTWELSFPYKNNKASADVYDLVNRFFEIKRHNGSLQSQPQRVPWNPPTSLPLVFPDQEPESAPPGQLPLLRQEDSEPSPTAATFPWTPEDEGPMPPPAEQEAPATRFFLYPPASPELQPRDAFDPYVPPPVDRPAAPAFGYPPTPPAEKPEDPPQPYLSRADEVPTPPAFGSPSMIRLDQPRDSFAPYFSRGATPEPPAEMAPQVPEDQGVPGLPLESDSPQQLKGPIPRLYRAIKEWWGRPAT